MVKTIKDHIDHYIDVMNIASMEMIIEDEYQQDFEAIFEKAAKEVERRLRIKNLAEGKIKCEQEQ